MMLSTILFLAGSAVAQSSDDTPHDEELEMLRIINEIRAAGHTCTDGTSYAPNDVEMVWDCRLWRAARVHSLHMTDTRISSHTWEDGTTYQDRAGDQGIFASGENISGGIGRTAQLTVDSLMTSSGHCRNMMKTNQRLFGAAYVAAGKAEDFADDYIRWTQMFAQSSELDDLDQSCLSSSGAAGSVETLRPTTAAPSATPNPTPAPTPQVLAPTAKTPKCAGSPAQRCKMVCPTKTCGEGECWMRKGYCCTRTCKTIE